MFSGCTGLTTAPELPAITLALRCYYGMFSGCTGLTTAPELPATTLAESCYEGMFSGCTGIMLSTTQTEECNTEYRIPSSGEGTTADCALIDMFDITGGTFTGTPDINTTYYIKRAITHTHNYTYTASGATITATCNDESCPADEKEVKLTISDPVNKYYNDGADNHHFTLENLERFNELTGNNISVDNIVYYKGDNTTSQIKNNHPVGAEYKAKLTVGGKTAVHTYKFTAMHTGHTYGNFTANGNVITATCTNTTGTCDDPTKALTLNAPLHTVYGDGKSPEATFTGEIPGVNNPTIYYSKGDVTLASAPTDAGTYTAWCQLGNATARVEYTIAKADTAYDTTPTAKTGLVYTGSPLDLVTAATSTSNPVNIYYGVGTDPNSDEDVYYSGSIPKMINAGTYYVWYKLEGGKNYKSIPADKVEVKIEKADLTPDEVTARSATYGQTLADVTLPTANDGTWAWKDPTTTSVGNAGTHTFKAVFTPTNTNYNTVEQIVTVNVAKADPTPDEVTDLTAAYGKTLEDVSLPNGWTWDAPETTVGNVGDNAFAATYTPDDTANYNTFNQDLTVTVVPVNKTALNDALTNANNYLDTIKNDADYVAPSSDLSTAISTVNAVLTNDNVTEAQVAQAITDVNNAVTTAKSDVKDIDDTKAAQAVTNKINALTAAENVSTADKTDIEAARAAYDELTEDQKAKVSADTLEKLTDAETALAAAEKDAADQAAANDVTSAINDLPAAEDITTADKTDIEAARKAYDELTDDQKAKVSAETKAKLEAAEEALAEAEKPVIKGDVNFDGKINVTDIVKIAAHVKGKKLLDKTAARAADVNGDSIIDVTDIIMIAAHIKGKKLL
jgi:hypothetical protein